MKNERIIAATIGQDATIDQAAEVAIETKPLTSPIELTAAQLAVVAGGPEVTNNF